MRVLARHTQWQLSESLPGPTHPPTHPSPHPQIASAEAREARLLAEGGGSSRPRGGWQGLDSFGGGGETAWAPGEGYTSFQGSPGGQTRASAAAAPRRRRTAGSEADGGPALAAECAALRAALAALSAQLAALPAPPLAQPQSVSTLIAQARQTVLQRQASGMLPASAAAPPSDTPLI